MEQVMHFPQTASTLIAEKSRVTPNCVQSFPTKGITWPNTSDLQHHAFNFHVIKIHLRSINYMHFQPISLWSHWAPCDNNCVKYLPRGPLHHQQLSISCVGHISALMKIRLYTNHQILLKRLVKSQTYFVMVPSTSEMTTRVFHFQRYIRASTWPHHICTISSPSTILSITSSIFHFQN